MKFNVIIPARFASTRLPGKLLLDIAGQPLIQRVYDKAVASGAERVIIATDDNKIAKCVKSFGAEVCMTSVLHTSGTERIAEVIELLKFDDNAIIVNLQGDEPLMPSPIIRVVAERLSQHEGFKVSTICFPIHTLKDLFNPNIVKVVMDNFGSALYFSRAPIPWDRDKFNELDHSNLDGQLSNTNYFRHVGLYAYRAGFVRQYVNFAPSWKEKTEYLEQLRVLDQGHEILVTDVQEDPGIGVDTQEDLTAVRNLFESQ